MKQTRFGKIALLCALLMIATLALVGCGGDKKSDSKKFINIATGGTAGTYYPIGGAMAEILNKAIPGMNASAQSTGASVANINMLKDGSVDLAIVQNDLTYYASNGTEMFKDKKVDNLRGIATLYPETCQIVTLADSGIETVADFRGRRVAVGAAGSGTEANARQILEAYGVAYADLSVQYLSFSEAANALKDGNVDVAFVTAGYPTAAIQDIASQRKVRLISVDPATADRLIAKYPFYTKATIPAGTYAGFDQEVNAVSVMAMLVTTDKMDDALGGEIAKAIFTNLDRLQSAHSVGKLITKESAMSGMSVKMNGGAEQFFKK
ncbi:MAG: TAXI family TRAP transporter solute-binding subunit [Schwartzia sp.]|nr:TAXI family TRAP transporter solute-binding subunit [Schwartzia sp. (in: firmicutes)]MBR1760959.1 TAXI family TRAP transporter solute-binding subunit [Schwartzia sp. (in: firmicutes)]MBR1886065.1 TAXI family TRAP transporter solute-binding subunit [Schwartzia sp. (in: firmicutes)]